MFLFGQTRFYLDKQTVWDFGGFVTKQAVFDGHEDELDTIVLWPG